MTSVIIRPATDTVSITAIRTLFLEYAATLGVDLAYQNFQGEVDALPGEYIAPRGCLYLALHGDTAVACVGIRPFDADICEMKRLYVRPEARGTGIGRTLAIRAIDFARTAGYRAMRLDTLPSMRGAHALYAALGFQPIPPYRFSPVAGNLFMELVLSP